MAASGPGVSLVVVTYDQARELPRTLRSLLPPYQHEVVGGFEVIVVDNGSPVPAAEVIPASLARAVRVHRIDDASPSPAAAANAGLAMAQHELIGLVIDGARLASPRLVSTAQQAAQAYPGAIVTAPAWHLGPDLQSRSAAHGYDEATEDALLASSGWEADGYQLFTIATPAASSARGLFGAMGESSSLFLSRPQWDALGGLDERFALPGGGLVNHDLYRRACALPDATLVVLLGEGTFHQVHGGAATSGAIGRDEMRADYERITGAAHRPPSNRPTFVGAIPPQYLPYVQRSAEMALGRMSDPHAADVDHAGRARDD